MLLFHTGETKAQCSYRMCSQQEAVLGFELMSVSPPPEEILIIFCMEESGTKHGDGRVPKAESWWTLGQTQILHWWGVIPLEPLHSLSTGFLRLHGWSSRDKSSCRLLCAVSVRGMEAVNVSTFTGESPTHQGRAFHTDGARQVTGPKSPS